MLFASLIIAMPDHPAQALVTGISVNGANPYMRPLPLGAPVGLPVIDNCQDLISSVKWELKLDPCGDDWETGLEANPGVVFVLDNGWRRTLQARAIVAYVHFSVDNDPPAHAPTVHLKTIDQLPANSVDWDNAT